MTVDTRKTTAVCSKTDDDGGTQRPTVSSGGAPSTPLEDEIPERIDDFVRVLRDPILSDLDIVRSRLSTGTPYIFRNDPEQYQALRTELSTHFGIHPQDTLLVGSGHLGFSLAPKKLWKPFDADSDLDMVVISDHAFVDMWAQTFAYDRAPKTPATEREAALFREFKKFHFRGRIFPNMLPVVYREEWFDYFNTLYGKFAGRKTTGTIFFNRHFFEQYHVSNVGLIRATLTEANK